MGARWPRLHCELILFSVNWVLVFTSLLFLRSILALKYASHVLQVLGTFPMGSCGVFCVGEG